MGGNAENRTLREAASGDVMDTPWEGLLSSAERMAVKADTREERAYWNGYRDGVRALRELQACAHQWEKVPNLLTEVCVLCAQERQLPSNYEEGR